MQLGLRANVTGVVINDIDPNNPAAQQGLQPADVIEAINRQPIHSVADFNRLAAQAKEQTLLRINRQGTGAFVVISPDESDDDQNIFDPTLSWRRQSRISVGRHNGHSSVNTIEAFRFALQIQPMVSVAQITASVRDFVDVRKRVVRSG